MSVADMPSSEDERKKVKAQAAFSPSRGSTEAELAVLN
jgi:hypothetical protein